MITRMAALLIALGINSAVAANDPQGIKVPISTASAQGLETSKRQRFVVLPDHGRAWVEVDLYDPLLESLDTYRMAIPGMRYDAARGAVVMAATGGDVICATVSEGGWPFRGPRVQPTGDCPLQHRYVTQSVDTGFAVEEVTYLELFVQPPSRPRAAQAHAG